MRESWKIIDGFSDNFIEDFELCFVIEYVDGTLWMAEESGSGCTYTGIKSNKELLDSVCNYIADFIDPELKLKICKDDTIVYSAETK